MLSAAFYVSAVLSSYFAAAAAVFAAVFLAPAPRVRSLHMNYSHSAAAPPCCVHLHTRAYVGAYGDSLRREREREREREKEREKREKERDCVSGSEVTEDEEVFCCITKERTAARTRQTHRIGAQRGQLCNVRVTSS